MSRAWADLSDANLLAANLNGAIFADGAGERVPGAPAVDAIGGTCLSHLLFDRDAAAGH